MSISKKIRFEVFKRDGFVCQYCGNNPPEVTLEVDHIKPKSKGGSDDINNLVTSCFDCNRGKSNIELKKIPNTLIENKQILEEKELQYLEYSKLLKRIERRVNKEIDQVNQIYNDWFEKYELSEKFKRTTVKKFIKVLGVQSVKESMDSACSRIGDSDQSIKYFCGICWSKIKDNNQFNHESN